MVGERQAVEHVRHTECAQPKHLLPDPRAHEARLARHEQRPHRVDDSHCHEQIGEHRSEQRLREAVGAVGDRHAQAVDADTEVVDEEADVARSIGHGVEDVREGAGDGKEAGRQEVGQHRVGVRVGHEVQLPRHDAQFPHEDDRWYDVCPEVGRLVRRFEDAPDALLEGALRMAVPGDDEPLPEQIRDLVDPVETRGRREHGGGERLSLARVTIHGADD